jgi:hypothetical protein
MTERKLTWDEARDMALAIAKEHEEASWKANEEEAKRLLPDDEAYLYRIGYGSMEESSFWEFSHSEKFSDDELAEVVENAIVDTIKGDRDRHDGEDCNMTFQDVMENPSFIEQLEKRGFTRVEYTAKFSAFGWTRCDDPDDWGQHTDSDEKAMMLRIRDKLKAP